MSTLIAKALRIVSRPSKGQGFYKIDSPDMTPERRPLSTAEGREHA